MGIKALLLDGFGTILDWRAPFPEVNEDAIKRAFGSVDGMTRLPPYPEWRTGYETLRQEDRARLDPEHRERDYRARFVESFARAGLAKRQARVLGERACGRYFQELSASARLAPDAGPEFWRALPDGLRIGLVSNYGHGESLRSALDRLGVFFRFDATVITGDVGYLKPHPSVFERALLELGAEPGEALMVGDDHVRDVIGATAAGMRAALVANPREGLRGIADSPQPPDASPAVARLASLAELPALIKQL